MGGWEKMNFEAENDLFLSVLFLFLMREGKREGGRGRLLNPGYLTSFARTLPLNCVPHRCFVLY